MDAYNNVPVVGHAHPVVVEAIARQAADLNTNTRYLHESVVLLAERLTASMPEELDTVMFVNSGSEANDLAWRLATVATGGHRRHLHHLVVPRPDRGHRGPVLIGVAARGAARHRRDHPGPGSAAWTPSRPAGRGRRQRRRAGRRRRDGWWSRASLRRPCSWTGRSPPTASSPPRRRTSAELRRQTTAASVIYVADEVQAGHGRTGDLWSFSASEVTPDLVTLGKPMGNGHPVAAVVARSEIVDRFAAEHEYFSTFGGNPVACAGRAGRARRDRRRRACLQNAADRRCPAARRRGGHGRRPPGHR